MVFLFEWFTIGVLAHPETIADYHFGSEAMLDKGGWYYRSASTYATVNLVEGIISIAVVLLFFLPALRRSWLILLAPYTALFLLVIGNQLVL